MREQPPVQIQAVVFRGDGEVEISYAEEREQSEALAAARIISVQRGDFEREFDILEEMIVTLVDDAWERHRNPPETIPARRRNE